MVEVYRLAEDIEAPCVFAMLIAWYLGCLVFFRGAVMWITSFGGRGNGRVCYLRRRKDGGLEFVVSHPFAKGANGWGTGLCATAEEERWRVGVCGFPPIRQGREWMGHGVWVEGMERQPQVLRLPSVAQDDRLLG